MERQAWEARRGRAIGETDGGRDGQKDRENMGEGGGGNNVLRAARKTVTYMSRGKVSDFPRAS